MDSFALLAYWGPRTEALADCATRSVGLVRCIGGLAPMLGDWYRMAENPTPVEVSEATFASLLEDGRDEFGFWLGLMVADRPLEEGVDYLALDVNAGNTFDIAPNRIDIRFPRKGPIADALLRTEAMISVFRRVVEDWRPERAIVLSAEHEEARGGGELRPSWMYYREGLSGRDDIPHRDWPGRGRLYLSTEEPFRHDDPVHVAAAAELARLGR